jgi:hypothetical protein
MAGLVRNTIMTRRTVRKAGHLLAADELVLTAHTYAVRGLTRRMALRAATGQVADAIQAAEGVVAGLTAKAGGAAANAAVGKLAQRPNMGLASAVNYAQRGLLAATTMRLMLLVCKDIWRCWELVIAGAYSYADITDVRLRRFISQTLTISFIDGSVMRLRLPPFEGSARPIVNQWREKRAP